MSSEKAGEFKTYVPPGYQEQKRKILDTGKATAGTFGEEDAALWAFENMKSQFWSFAEI